MPTRVPVWPPPEPSPWQQFRRQPTIFLAKSFHRLRPSSPLNPTADPTNPISVVCISDTHNTTPDVPDGDLLLHAGDLTNTGSFKELQAQLDWLATLPHRHKVVIAGNHDRVLDPQYIARHPDRFYEPEGNTLADLNWHDITYLENSSATIQFPSGRSLSIFGSPLTPDFGVFAFQYPTIRDVWKNLVPENTDILLTHGPPKGYLDLEGRGCPFLTKEVVRACPKAVVFGHIHEGNGRTDITYSGVERGYQRVLSNQGGMWTVFSMVFWLVAAWLRAPFRLLQKSNGTSRRSKTTIMVNAAVVSGTRNEGVRPIRTIQM